MVFSACAAGTTHVLEKSEKSEKVEMPEVFLLSVESPQELVYNGAPQPVSFVYTGQGEPEIVYYSSIKDRDDDTGGSHEAPVHAGAYYVRLRIPGSRREFFADMRILRCPVVIEAQEIQEDIYNGNPKRIKAESTPKFPLSASYYPNLELREKAKKAVNEPGVTGPSVEFKGYRRVDRPPTEPGTYYVWVYFPGDENYEAADADVEFRILPAVMR